MNCIDWTKNELFVSDYCFVIESGNYSHPNGPWKVYECRKDPSSFTHRANAYWVDDNVIRVFDVCDKGKKIVKLSFGLRGWHRRLKKKHFEDKRKREEERELLRMKEEERKQKFFHSIVELEDTENSAEKREEDEFFPRQAPPMTTTRVNFFPLTSVTPRVRKE